MPRLSLKLRLLIGRERRGDLVSHPFVAWARAGLLPPPRVAAAAQVPNHEKRHVARDEPHIPELTEERLEAAIPARLRKRLMRGLFEFGEDIAALRSFVGLTQAEFVRPLEISVHTLRNREQGRRKPEGSASALLRTAVRHPRIIRENLEAAV